MPRASSSSRSGLGRLAVQPRAVSCRRLQRLSWLGAQRVAGVLQDAVEQVSGPDLCVAEAIGVSGSEVEGAFSQQVDA
jgi:hypothetical protein